MKVICFTGTDGAGKTTLAKGFVEELERRGLRVSLVWSRYNNVLSKLLLGPARLLGYSHFKTEEGVVLGFHDFEKVWWLRWPFAFLQMLDCRMMTAKKMRRLRNTCDVLVFERSPWDTLSDVMADTGLANLHRTAIGRGIVGGFVRGSRVVWVRRDLSKIAGSRKELAYDYKLPAKFDAYSRLAPEFNWTVLENDRALEEVRKELCGPLADELLK